MFFLLSPGAEFPRIPCQALAYPLALPHPQQGGAQISLAEVCRSGERSTRWYNLLSYKYLKKQSREPKPVGATPGPESMVSWAPGWPHPPMRAGPGWMEGEASPKIGEGRASEVGKQQRVSKQREGIGGTSAKEQVVPHLHIFHTCALPFCTLLDIIELGWQKPYFMCFFFSEAEKEKPVQDRKLTFIAMLLSV